MLLTTKSIIDCNEFEEDVHNKEISDFADYISTLPNYECMVTFFYMKNGKVQKDYQNCYLHNFLEMAEYVDIKQGIDLTIGNNNILTIIAYGEIINKEGECRKTEISILPYIGEYEFIDLFSEYGISNYNVEGEFFN